VFSRSKWRMGLPPQPMIRKRQVVVARGGQGSGERSEPKAGEPGVEAVGAGDGFDHRLGAVTGVSHRLAAEAGVGGGDAQAVLKRRCGTGGRADRAGSSGGESKSGGK